MIDETLNSLSQKMYGKDFGDLLNFTEEEIENCMKWPQPPDGGAMQLTVRLEYARIENMKLKKDLRAIKKLLDDHRNNQQHPRGTINEIWDITKGQHYV